MRRFLVISVCGILVLSGLGATVSAQTRSGPAVDERSPITRQRPLRFVKVQNRRTPACANPNCLKVSVDDLGTTNGLYFESLAPTQQALRGAALRGALCSCDLRSCRPADGWTDQNLLTGWSPIKINESIPAMTQLRTYDNRVWAIGWYATLRDGTPDFGTPTVLVSTAPRSDPRYTDPKVVVQCTPVAR